MTTYSNSNYLKNDYYPFVLSSLFGQDVMSLADQCPRLNTMLNIYKDLNATLSKNQSNFDDDKNLFSLIIDKIHKNSEQIFKIKMTDRLKINLKSIEETFILEKQNYETSLRFMKQHCNFKKVNESNVAFFDSKSKEYTKMAQNHEAYLKNLGFHDQLTDEFISNLNQENEKIKEEIDLINQKLSDFDFNPNENDLKFIILKMKEELVRYEDELEKALDVSKESY